MTRANVVLITEQGKFKFQSNSSAYPSYLARYFFDLIVRCASTNSIFIDGFGFYEPDSLSLSTFIDEAGLTLGSVGNFNYAYELDFVKKTFKIWESSIRWVNAPSDWKERGWNCWIGENGKYGYPNWVKSKVLINISFTDMVIQDNEKFNINRKILELTNKL